MKSRHIEIGALFTSGLFVGIWIMGESIRYLLTAIVILVVVYIPHSNILQLFEEEEQ